MSCGIVHRHGSDPALLWLWYRPEAVAPIQPLAWEPPCATGVALKSKAKKKKKEVEQRTSSLLVIMSWLEGWMMAAILEQGVELPRGQSQHSEGAQPRQGKKLVLMTSSRHQRATFLLEDREGLVM